MVYHTEKENIFPGFSQLKASSYILKTEAPQTYYLFLFIFGCSVTAYPQ